MAPTLQRVLFVPDVHRPFHDKGAWRLMLRAARDFKPHILVILGDFADFMAVSSHSKDPRRRTQLPAEVANANRGLDELDALGAKEKVFLGGNHEDRLRRYLQDKAPELFGLVDIPDLFALHRRGWEYVPYKEHRRLGRAWLTHDVGTAGRYAAFAALNMYGHSIISAHTHRMAYIVEGTPLGEARVSATFGWLGDRTKVDYLQRGKVMRDTALGFGIGYQQPNGLLHLVPIPIVKGTCVVEGRLYG